MKQVIAIAEITYKQGLRLKAFIGVAAVTLLVFVFSGALSQLSIGDIFKVTQDICLMGLSGMGLFISIFLGTQMLATDIEQKTVHLVLTKPIPRWYYLVGRYIGLCFLTLVATGLGFAVLMAFLYYFQKHLPIYHAGDIHLINYLLFFVAFEIRLFLVTAIGLFFSTFASSGLISFFFTFVIYFIASNLQNVKFILESNLGENISKGLKLLFDISYWVVPNLSLLDFKNAAVHGLHIGVYSYSLSLTYGILYSIGLILVSCFIFEKREFF